MAVDLTLLNSNSLNNIETNFERVQTALGDAVSRSGNTPNQMNADLDMNSNSILNIDILDVEGLLIDGVPVVPSDLGSFAPNSVGAAQIIDGSVGNAELADEAVSLDNIDPSTISVSFPTRADAQAYIPSVGPDFIRTEGYDEVGDNGGALYKKVGSEPSHTGKLSITLDDASVQWYEIASQQIFGEMFGLKFDSDTANATSNSTAFQNAVDFVEDRGGGIVHFAGGGDLYAYLDAVPIVPARVSLKGNDGYGTRFRKFGNTASSETSSLVPRWGGGAIGNPIAVIQFGHIGGTNWSGNCEHISVFGNNLDQDTTTTVFGFFFSGMSTGRVHRCTAEYVQNGFFWSNGNTILSEVTMNVTNYTLRGFYQEFATSTLMASNFAARSKYLGYSWCGHYSLFAANAADHNGEGASTTEIPLVYDISGCFGGHIQDNGAEFGKGSVMRIGGCRDLVVTGNVVLVHGSDYTGSGDVVGIELGANNINVKVFDNQFELDTPTGTANRHFNWKVSADQYGEYVFARNRFYNDWTTAGESTGWTNTSGNLRTDRGTCTVTLTGLTTTETGTAEWRCEGGIVTLTLPGMAGTSNTTDCTITGLPSSLAPSDHRYPLMLMLDNGVRITGRGWVHTNGTIYLLLSGNTINSFTNSGVKGIYDSTITYSL